MVISQLGNMFYARFQLNNIYWFHYTPIRHGMRHLVCKCRWHVAVCFRCKSVQRRYTPCPVPSCKTPKRKLKRLRPIPAKLLVCLQVMKSGSVSDG